MDFIIDESDNLNILFLPDVFPKAIKTIENTVENIEDFILSEDDTWSGIVNMNLIKPKEKIKIEYDTMPNMYINKELWLQTTNLHCWTCSEVPKGMPITIPIQKTKITVPDNVKMCEILDLTEISDSEVLMNKSEKNVKEVFIQKPNGIFCCIQCAGWYLNTVNDKNILNKWQSVELLKDLYFDWTGISLIDIPGAADFTCMKKYKGPTGVSRQEYDIINEQILSEYIKK